MSMPLLKPCKRKKQKLVNAITMRMEYPGVDPRLLNPYTLFTTTIIKSLSNNKAKQRRTFTKYYYPTRNLLKWPRCASSSLLPYYLVAA